MTTIKCTCGAEVTVRDGSKIPTKCPPCRHNEKRRFLKHVKNYGPVNSADLERTDPPWA